MNTSNDFHQEPEGSDEKLDRMDRQQERNTRDIDALLEAISTTDVQVRNLSETVAENSRLFEIQQAEFKADRLAWQERAEALDAKVEADRAEWRAGFDASDARAKADRLAWQAKSEALEVRIEADRAEWRERFDEAIEIANQDRALAEQRHQAQQEIIQTLLIELTRTNQRVGSLEQAS